MKKRLLISLIAALIVQSVNAAQVDEPSKFYGNEKGDVGFTGIEMVQTNMQQLIPCLEYKIHGISMRMYLSKFGVPIIYWTLNVSHNLPENLYMTHFELDQIPLLEFNALLGKPYKAASDKIIQLAMKALGAPNINEIASSKFFHQDYNDYQSHNLYESTVLGNPSMLIFQMFNNQGLKPKDNLDEKYGMSEDKSSTEIVDGWTNGQFLGGISVLPAIAEIRNSIGAIEGLIEVINTVNEAINTVSATTGKQLDIGSSLFCPSIVEPYVPQYLSGIDAAGWRMGYPLTDAEHSVTVVNPFSSDKVGGEFIIPPVTLPVMQTFGNIYPREGTVNHPQTTKAAMVIASRTQSLISDSEAYRIVPGRNKVPSTGVWSRNYPDKKQKACHQNIAYTGLDEHTQAKHAWTQWPKHRCDLVRKGQRIAFIPIEIQITPEVGE